MTKIEEQILGNQCEILAAISRIFRNDGRDPLVKDTLQRIGDAIEQTLDLIEREKIAQER